MWIPWAIQLTVTVQTAKYVLLVISEELIDWDFLAVVGMVDLVFADRIRECAQLRPTLATRLVVHATLLEDDHVSDHLCACVILERCAWEAVSSN